jgi:hypothetical protein
MCDKLLHRIRHKHGFFREQVIVIQPLKELTPMEPKCLSLGSQKHVKEPYLEGDEPSSQFQVPLLYDVF